MIPLQNQFRPVGAALQPSTDGVHGRTTQHKHFLNAPRQVDKPLYVTYLEGFSDKENKHCLLVRRMLYGLHDAPMGWFLEVKRHLTEDQGFTQSKNDACLVHKPGVWVVGHVDDCASTGEPEKKSRSLERSYTSVSR